jgi:sialate O-acetylesterase
MRARPLVLSIAFHLLGISLLFSAAAESIHAQQPSTTIVRVNHLFSDNMVLQRGIPVHVWGTADGDAAVTVSFNGQQVRTTAKDRQWQIALQPLEAGGPFTLTVAGPANKIQFNNVLVGDVWVAGGQSNMDMSIENCVNAASTIADSANSQIRLLWFDHRGSAKPESEIGAGSWSECGPKTINRFSAVAYFFGRDLQKKLHVPIGLISASVGGTTAERWMSKETLDAATDLRAMPRTQGANDLYDGMIHPLIPFAIRGAIWYQGESNADRAWDYRKLFPDLIQNWRADWKQGDFPFLFVQLAPFMKRETGPTKSQWAELRDAQLHTMRTVPNTAMAVITDVGDEVDIHPKRKQPVGERLATAALALSYDKKIEYSGPIFDRLTIDGNRAVVHFTHVGQGLEMRGSKLTGFTIAQDNEIFFDADARIEGDSVIVTDSAVTKPRAVRLGWANYPVVNLWNKDGLPASPFRSDDFQLTTQASPNVK